MNPIEIVLVAALVVWVLYRQVTGRFVRPADAAWKLPLVLTAVGLVMLVRAHPSPTAVAVAIAVVDVLVTAGIGALRGRVVRLEVRDGWLYQRGGVPMLLMWLVTIGVRVGIAIGGAAIGAGPLLTATTMLSVGISLLVQAAVLNLRVAQDGRPVRPVADRGARRERATL